MQSNRHGLLFTMKACVYRRGLLGILVSERFLLVSVLDLEKSNGTERLDQNQT